MLRRLSHLFARPVSAIGWLRVGTAVPLAAACWLGYVVVKFGGLPGFKMSLLAANALMVVISAANVLMTWSVGTHSEGATARAWRRVALAYAFPVIGNMCWLYTEIVLGGNPSKDWGNVPFLLLYPALLWGLLSFPHALRGRTDVLRFALDAAIVMVAGGMVTWHFVVLPTLAGADESGVALALSLAYPVGDLLALLGTISLYLRRPQGAARRPLAFLTAGVLVYLAGDLVWAHLALVDQYESGGIGDTLYMLAYVLLIAAGSQERRRLAAAEPGVAIRRGRTVSLVPYAAVAVGCMLLFVVSRNEGKGSVPGLVVGAVLLTGLVVARQAVAVRVALAREARFRSLVQQASDVIMIVRRDGAIGFASPSLATLFGYDPATVRNAPLTTLLHEDDAPRARAFLAEASAGTDITARGEWRVRHADGSCRFAESTGANLLDDPTVRGIVLTMRDVSERAALQAQLTHQASHDPLTGLANRRLFQDRVEQALLRAARSGDGVAVLFLDLDNFKTVNDSLGHAAGDRLLVETAARLLNATRGCDAVARLGGDEFAVLVEATRDDADALAVAERIATAFRAPFVLDGREAFVGASIGIAPLGAESSVESLLRDADAAMYAAKSGGKGRCEVFQTGMQATALDRLGLEANLRQAVERGQFVVHYQPVVVLETGEVAGVEALVRWQHPARGLVPPAEFIPLAEETGLIVPIGRWVLGEACRQGAAWHAERAGEAPLTLSVNLSSQQLQDPALVSDVASALAASGFPAGSLVLEITETAAMQDIAATVERLRALKALGLRVAIDDFGTGYSSLASLQRFPVDVLKIDKAFVDGVAGGGPDAALARAIVALGQALGLRTIAEGVEDVAQCDYLQTLGCGYGQGYLFARPLPPAELAALLDAQLAGAAAERGAPDPVSA